MTNGLNRHKWITKAEATSRYNISERTLDRLAANGVIRRARLPHRRPGVFLSVEDLDTVLEVERD